MKDSELNDNKNYDMT